MRAMAKTTPDRTERNPATRGPSGRFSNGSLRTKLLATMIPVAVVPLLLSSLLSLTTASDALTRSVEQNARATVSTLQQQFEHGTARVAQDVLLTANLAETALFGTQPTSRMSFLTSLNRVWGYATID